MTMKSRAKFFTIGDLVQTRDGVQGCIFSVQEQTSIGVMKAGGRFLLVSLDDLEHFDDSVVDPGQSFKLEF